MSVNRAVLPASLYTAEQTRALDSAAINQFGIPGIRLMQRAGHAVFAEMLERYPKVKSVTVLCGAGNNGGDGFVIAALAMQKGLDVQLVCIGDSNFEGSLKGEALDAWQQLQVLNIEYQLYEKGIFFRGELIVDALLGTGLSGDVRGLFEEAIAQVNRGDAVVFSVDIPSGLCADTGRILGVAIKADITVSFIGLKRGLLTGDAVDLCGQLLFDDLKVPSEVYETVPIESLQITDADMKRVLPARSRRSHKGLFGHVLVIGGDHGMGGAALLAAEAAMRSGAGLVSLATRSEHVSAALCRCPEVMVKGVDSVKQLQPLLNNADVIVLGPGLGQNAWSEQMVWAALVAEKPIVLDADALNILVKDDLFSEFDEKQRKKWLLTPHPGEAARILSETVAELEFDRFAALKRLQAVCGGTVVLKGAGSLISAGGVTHLCHAGNPGMAVGGMGDVLSGICGAFLAQGASFEDAARIGVYVHANAADRVASAQGEIGMRASDIFSTLSKVINSKYE